MRKRISFGGALTVSLVAGCTPLPDASHGIEDYSNLSLTGLSYTARGGADNYLCSAPGLAPYFAVKTSEGLTEHFIAAGTTLVIGGFERAGDAVFVEPTIVLVEDNKGNVSGTTYEFGKPPHETDIPDMIKVLLVQTDFTGACKELNLPTGRGETAKNLGPVKYLKPDTLPIPLPPAVIQKFALTGALTITAKPLTP